MERQTRKVLIAITILAALAGIFQLGVVFWARLEIMQAESPVALHSVLFSRTGQLYYDLNHYPFIHSPYMPLFYAASAGFDRLGLPPLASGRLLSACAALGILALTWNLLSLCTSSRYACWAGTLLVAITANLWVYGTVGRVDVPAVMFSLAALCQYARFRKDARPGSVVWAGLWVLIAIFFKQTMIAAGAAITLALATASLKRAFWFAVGVGGAAAGCVFALDAFTAGRFLDNTFRANINPLNVSLIWSQLEYFALVGG
jgi:predicted membrane-bound mannosyltransferase